MLKLVAFVGPSGSGKTTLIERLVPALQAAGLTVGVIKNDAHGFQMDREGKDSDRFFRAGADGVLIQSPTEVAYRRAHGDRDDPTALAARFFPDCDLVLVEGGKDTDLPKIEVWRSATQPARLRPRPAKVVGVVTDTAAAAATIADQPTFTWDDVAGICAFVLWRHAGDGGA